MYIDDQSYIYRYCMKLGLGIEEMETTMKAISAAMKLIDVKKENLKKAFDEVESQASSLASFTLTWSQIESHFASIQSSLEQKFKLLQTLESQPQINPNLARPQLRSLCQNMDALGLRQFIIHNPRERESIRLELPDAFAAAPNAALLVLDAMEGFSLTNDVELRRACVMLLEELMELKFEIKGEVREKGLITCIECKEKLDCVVTSSNRNTFGVLGFLLLVVVYGLRYAFSDDDLIDYIAAVAKNKIAVRLCRLLEFGADQISGLIQKLISNGNQILAVKFIIEFEMTKKFPPVQLLSEYAKESKSRDSRNPNGQPVMKEAAIKELDNLKSVVKCLEDYKLASKFPNLNAILQRIRRLEKEKLNKKRFGEDSASVLEKQPKLEKESIVNDSRTTGPSDSATVKAIDVMPENQSNLQKEIVIDNSQTAVPASVPTRDTANTTIPENVAAGSAMPLYQQIHSNVLPNHPDPYNAAPTGPYGVTASNPDVASYTGLSSNMYELSNAHMNLNGNPQYLYPSGSQIPATSPSLYPQGLQMPSGYYDGNTAYGAYGWPPESHPSYHPQ